MVLGADAQTGGPVYDFRISRYEIRNDQFIEFLNDAILNLDNERGQYMYFDVDSGNVYIVDVSTMGTVGTDGSGTLLSSPAVGGRITCTEDVCRMVSRALPWAYLLRPRWGESFALQADLAHLE